jgi:hypothetical protein
MQGLSGDPRSHIWDLIEGTDGSKLVFTICQPSLAVDVGRLRRTREPVSRSKSTIQGKVADVIAGHSRHAESQNELKAFRVLMATGRPDAWQEQPFRLEYHHEGSRHSYTPDILIAWGSHREVVEVKEDSDADSAENQARFRLIRKLLTEHGFHFRVWKKSEICAEPRLTNAALILRYRAVEVSAVNGEIVRRMFSESSELPLRSFLVPETMQSVLRLVLAGRLHINWWEPLGLDSRVSSVPIGPQIWPFPPSTVQEDLCPCMP